MRCCLLLLGCLTLCPFMAFAETVIKVGGYEFPPFVNTKSVGQFNGATLDLIDDFNRIQNEYRFEFVLTSPKRRYIDFTEHRYDMIMFESINWGWESYPVEASRVYMKGGEVYIAYKREDRDQHFFDDLAKRKLVAILGYHYGFAGFNADEEYLTNHFQILLSIDHLRNIRLILVDRPELAEVAVVTRSFLGDYLNRHPEKGKSLLISEKLDQEYQHSILVRKGAAISVDQINMLLDKLEKQGVLQRLRVQYGLVN